MRVLSRINWVKAALVASTAIIPLTLTTVAFAQEQKSTRVPQISYDIPAQPLARSLNAFARVSNIKIAYSSELTKGKSAPAIRGAYTASAALARLLDGSGLSHQYIDEHTITIALATGSVKNVEGDNSTVLEPIIVKGARGTNSGPGDAELQAETYRGAGTSAYISKENIERFRGSSAGDMLSGIPGVMNGENRNSGALDVNIRGMQGQGRSPVVIDGAMQETTVWRGYTGMAGRTYIDPDFIGGVSIEKGPSTGPDAAGAIGGVVRARTLNAGDIIAPGGTWGVTVKTGLQGNNVAPPPGVTLGGEEGPTRNYNRPDPFDLRGKSGSVVAAYRTDMFDLVAGYAKRDNGNYYSGSNGRDPDSWGGRTNRFGYDEQVVNTSMDNTSYLLRGVFRPDEDHTLDLSYMRYESLFGEMKASQLIWGTEPYQSPSEVEVDTYTARYRYNPDNPLIDFRADLWATNVSSLVINPVRFPGLNMDTFSATLSERWGSTVHNTSRFDGVGGALALNYGFSYDYEDFGKSKDWTSLNDQYPGRANDIMEGWRQKGSVFFNAEYKPEEWLTFTAGARYLKNIVQDTKPSTSDPDSPINRDEARGWAPAFSVMVEPVKGVQLYTRYAEALRAASPFEATNGFTGAINPFSDLKPEHAHNTEIGVNYQKYGMLTADDLFQAKVGMFNNDVTNYITLLDVENLGMARTNVPRVRMQGFEVSGRYDTSNLFVSLGATNYTDIKSCNAFVSGSTVECYDYVPRPRLGLSWFKGHVPPKRTFSATIGGRFLDEKLTLGARYSYTQHIPSYELVDLFGNYRISDSTTLSFSVDNVFDKYYIDALSLGQDVAALPGPGRTFRVNLTNRFGDGDRSATSSADDRAAIASAAERSEPLLGDFNGDWTGFYVGANWGGTHYSAEGETRSGNGSFSDVAASERTDRNANSAIGGLQAGYNKQFDGGIVLGFEIDGNLARGRIRQTFDSDYLARPSDRDDIFQADYRQSYGAAASARARVGQAFGRTLLYGTGGAGFVQEKQTRTQYRSNGSVSEPYFTETDEQIRAGLMLGGGLEFAFNDKLSLRGEYLFGYYPEKTFKFDRAGQNVDAASVDVPIGREASNKLTTHSLRVGLNYKF